MQSSWQDPPPGQGGFGDGGLRLAWPPMTPVVKKLIVANGAIFLGMFLIFLPAEGLADFLQRWFGMSPGLWIDYFPFVPFWQLLTWGFLHSVTDPLHVILNMLFLYVLGTMLEAVVGGRRFLVTYVGALLVAGLATLVVGILAGPLGPAAELGARRYPTTVGASGAVFCVVAAIAVLRPNTRILFFFFPITLKVLAIGYIGLQAFYWLLTLKGATSNVAYLAHLAGAGWGFLVARTGWIWADPLEILEERRARGAAQREAADRERVDRLLEKINREGIHSLTAQERAFLKRVSKR